MSAIEILRRTRAILTAKTWVGHAPDRKAGEVCLVTALDQALGPYLFADEWWPTRDVIYGCIKDKFPTRKAFGEDGLAGFNDHEDTTLEDVLSVVDCAIEKQH